MKPNSTNTLRLLTIAVSSTLLIACGGDSDDSGSGGSTTTSASSQNQTEVTTDTVEGDEISTTTHVEGSDVTAEVLPEPDSVTVNNNPNNNNTSTDVVTTSPVDATNEKIVFNRLNDRRTNCGFGELKVSQKLTDAAKNHANYILHMGKNSTQGFQGHYEVEMDDFSGIKNPFYSGRKVENRIMTTGVIGSQAKAVDYPYKVVGENLSYRIFNDSYAKKYTDNQLAIQAINSLFAAPYHLASLVSPAFNHVGISYGRGDSKSKIKLSDGTSVPAQGSILEMVMARPATQDIPSVSKVMSYPCDGVEDTAYELRNEVPNPFKGTARDLATDPIGQPIYILGNGELVVTNYKMVDAANKDIPLQKMDAANDPNQILGSNEVILMPLDALEPNQLYRVTYRVSVDKNAPQTKSFSFKTKAKQ